MKPLLIQSVLIVSLGTSTALAQDMEEGYVSDGVEQAVSQQIEQPSQMPSNAAGDVYIVKPGDTLWDISAQVLQNPWYWPKIWSYNPEITNPHWIYPGDQIRFYAPADELPTLADFAGREVELPEDEGMSEDETYADADGLDKEDIPENEQTLKFIGYEKKVKRTRGTQQALADVFVTPKQLTEAGIITKAAEEKILLSSFDKIYLKFPSGQEVNIGERYVIFRTTGEVVHPISRREYGYMTQVTGICKVVRVNENVATAVVSKALDVVERGQFVTPFVKDLYRQVAPRPNFIELKGVVLATHLQATHLIGENELVFIDKGRDDGVKVGNTFHVIYQGDPLFGPDEEMPEEHIAQLLIVDVKRNASTALVTYALREVEVGNPVHMVPTHRPQTVQEELESVTSETKENVEEFQEQEVEIKNNDDQTNLE